jgi:hypothetical protein
LGLWLCLKHTRCRFLVPYGFCVYETVRVALHDFFESFVPLSYAVGSLTSICMVGPWKVIFRERVTLFGYLSHVGFVFDLQLAFGTCCC